MIRRSTRPEVKPPEEFELLPKHTGKFLELSVDQLEMLADRGFRRVGVGIALLNPAGQILAVEQRGDHKFEDGMKGIISETVTAVVRNGKMEPEPVINTISRCISEELGLDPTGLRFATRLDQPFGLSEWPISKSIRGYGLFGINVALLADQQTADKLASARPTREIRRAYFCDVEDLTGMTEGWDKLRPGTLDCLESLDINGLLIPDNLAKARIELPAQDAATNDLLLDIDLSRF